MSQLRPLGLLLLAAACGGATQPPPPPSGGAPTNRLHVPPEVVGNLGITFREARRGRLEIRMAVPGRLEAPEDRRWTLRAPAAGRVRLLKPRWADVKAGEKIAELLPDDLHVLLDALVESRRAVLEAEAGLLRARAGEAPHEELAKALAEVVAEARVRVKGRRALLAQADALRESARARAAELDRLAAENAISQRERVAAQKETVEAEVASLEAGRAFEESLVGLRELEVRAAHARADADSFAGRLAVLEDRARAATLARTRKAQALATLTGLPEAELLERDAWARLAALPLAAPADGTLVELRVGNGEWVDASTALAEIVDTGALLFRGQVPEGDLARLRPGASVRVVSPAGAFEPHEAELRGPLPVADPVTRTVRVEAAVANGGRLPAGVSATALVLVESGEHEEVLAPADCVAQDELETIVFRLDPEAPEYVIRTPVALGRRSAGWVEVLAGVGAGDRLVRDGIHQLKQTGVGRPSAKGHFHADGTWHDGDH